MAQRFQIWPAIDLCGGRCVRLLQGDYQQETVYGEDPVAMAQRWESEGADFLHLVDLDAAVIRQDVHGHAWVVPLCELSFAGLEEEDGGMG